MKNAKLVQKTYKKYINDIEFHVELLKEIDYLTDSAIDEIDVILGDIDDATQTFLKVVGEYQRATS